jgi:hypothetical protein
VKKLKANAEIIDWQFGGASACRVEVKRRPIPASRRRYALTRQGRLAGGLAPPRLSRCRISESTLRSRGGSEMGKDAGDERGSVKRLGDIIGGARFKAAVPVSLAQRPETKMTGIWTS